MIQTIQHSAYHTVLNTGVRCMYTHRRHHQSNHRRNIGKSINIDDLLIHLLSATIRVGIAMPLQSIINDTGVIAAWILYSGLWWRQRAASITAPRSLHPFGNYHLFPASVSKIMPFELRMRRPFRLFSHRSHTRSRRHGSDAGHSPREPLLGYVAWCKCSHISVFL